MLDSGYKALSDIVDVLLFKVTTFPPNLEKIGQIVNEWHKFFNFKLVAAIILDFGFYVFSDIIDVFDIKVVTFTPSLVKIGQIVKERHQFFGFQCGSSRHVGFWFLFRYH